MNSYCHLLFMLRYAVQTQFQDHSLKRPIAEPLTLWLLSLLVFSRGHSGFVCQPQMLIIVHALLFSRYTVCHSDFNFMLRSRSSCLFFEVFFFQRDCHHGPCFYWERCGLKVFSNLSYYTYSSFQNYDATHNIVSVAWLLQPLEVCFVWPCLAVSHEVYWVG